MKESELLRAGAANIRRYGWHQDGYGWMNEGFCLFGSMRLNAAMLQTLEPLVPSGDWPALGDPDLSWTTAPRLARLAGLGANALDHEDGSGELVKWNDTEGRTVDEVLNLLDKAAEEAEAEGK